MSEVFTDEQSVFFVGGRGDGSGAIADAGGCTKDWWDAEVAASDEATAMAKLMTSTGGPIINMGDAGYDGVTERVNKAGVGAGAEIGMVAYIIKDGGPGIVNPDRYKITDVDPADNWVECSGIGGTDCRVTIAIGGAFDTLSNATDETSATTHSVWIHTNLAETLAGVITITTGGNSARNTFKRILGFNTLPGDMDRGGAYYESPFEMLESSIIDLTKTVRLDANGGSFELLSISADNIIIENLYLFNNVSATYAAIIFVGTPQNIVLRNCRYRDVRFIYKTAADFVLVDSCFAIDLAWHIFVIYGQSNIFLSCIADNINAAVNFVTAQASSSGTQVIGCLTIGGLMGVSIVSDAFLINNTFYNQTDYGVNILSGGISTVLNNIFALYPGAVGMRITGSGSIIYNDYNCFIESDGTPLTVGLHSAGYETPVLGPNSIETDPLFENVAVKNFRLKSNSPCRRGGKPTVGAT